MCIRDLSKLWLAVELAAFICWGALTGLASHARADDMDLSLSRLSVGACEDTIPGASDNFRLRDRSGQTLRPDNAAWSRLVTQLSPVLMPAVLAPVTTSGPMGFDLALQTNITGIDADAEYWENGTRGHGPAAQDTCVGSNRFVSSVLTSNRLSVAKGLPMGITLGAEVGRIWNTSLWTVGGNLKWALIEGYRQWALPDFALRAAANALVGDSQLSMVALAADAIVSKTIVVARAMQIAPYAGGGVGFAFASSDLIDLTPNIDATQCAAGKDPACQSLRDDELKGDIGHDQTFRQLTLTRTRAFVGLQLRYRLFAFASELAFDIVPPRKADRDAGSGGLPRQWTVNFAPSLSF